MAQAFLPNTMPLQVLRAGPSALLEKSLDDIIQTCPPLDKYNKDSLGGLCIGYTGIAYLFFQMAQRHPNLRIQGHDGVYWARRYLSGDRGILKLEDQNCGILSEKMSFEAVRACVSKDPKDVSIFLDNVPAILAPISEDGRNPFPNELIYGRAGALYMLRMVRHFVPDSKESVNPAISKVCQRVVDSNDDGNGNWMWNGKHYIGAAHGDIGTIAQLVLSDASFAPKLTEHLETLLAAQNDAGNWFPTDVMPADASTDPGRVQFCHGAPGFIYALQSLKPNFPSLKDSIDGAIERGRAVTWERGLLVKEPSLCHGLFGNGLVFPTGEKREHFLSLATPDSLNELRTQHPDLFQPADYDTLGMSVIFSYQPSAAWAWTVVNDDVPALILFNDV